MEFKFRNGYEVNTIHQKTHNPFNKPLINKETIHSLEIEELEGDSGLSFN